VLIVVELDKISRSPWDWLLPGGQAAAARSIPHNRGIGNGLRPTFQIRRNPDG
jgi:hypothetical protein